ncbi:hypothetical protein D3C78_1396560 [compost metagenome]
MRVHLGEQHLKTYRLLLPLLQLKLVNECDDIIYHVVKAVTKGTHLVSCPLSDTDFDIQLLVQCLLHAPL